MVRVIEKILNIKCAVVVFSYVTLIASANHDPLTLVDNISSSQAVDDVKDATKCIKELLSLCENYKGKYEKIIAHFEKSFLEFTPILKLTPADCCYEDESELFKIFNESFEKIVPEKFRDSKISTGSQLRSTKEHALAAKNLRLQAQILKQNIGKIKVLENTLAQKTMAFVSCYRHFSGDVHQDVSASHEIVDLDANSKSEETREEASIPKKKRKQASDELNSSVQVESDELSSVQVENSDDLHRQPKDLLKKLEKTQKKVVNLTSQSIGQKLAELQEYLLEACSNNTTTSSFEDIEPSLVALLDNNIDNDEYKRQLIILAIHSFESSLSQFLLTHKDTIIRGEYLIKYGKKRKNILKHYLNFIDEYREILFRDSSKLENIQTLLDFLVALCHHRIASQNRINVCIQLDSGEEEILLELLRCREHPKEVVKLIKEILKSTEFLREFC